VLFANEVDVWQWTLEAAIIEPSDGARAQVRLCLGTYPEQMPTGEEVARLGRLAPRDGNSAMRWRETESEGA